MKRFPTIYSPLHWVLNVGIDQHAVHFRVNVLDGNLEAVEEPCLGDLHFTAEAVYLPTINTCLSFGSSSVNLNLSTVGLNLMALSYQPTPDQ